ncbi:MAG TPA: hypothetical protein VF142_06845 [Longimicrobium sp.]
MTTTPAVTELDDLRRQEEAAATTYEDGDRQLAAIRAHLDALDQQIRSGTSAGAVAAVARLSAERDQRVAELRTQDGLLEAKYHALRLARARRADAERLALAAQSGTLAAGVEAAVADALAVVQAYLTARERYVQTLRDSASHTGSVVGAPGFARPSGMGARVLRLVTEQRGLSW